MLGLCVCGGLFVYLLAIGVVFYSLTENLESMTSYQRYLSSYIGVILVLIAVFGLQILFDHLLSRRKSILIAISAIFLSEMLIMPLDMVPTVFGIAKSTNDASREAPEDYQKFTEWGRNINSLVGGGSDEHPDIFLAMNYNSFPDTPSLNAEIALMSYFTLPLEMQNFGQFRYNPDPSLSFYSKKEWGEVLIDEKFSYVLLPNFSSDSIIWWKPAETEYLSHMYSLFDIPPEELDAARPLLFEVQIDSENQVHLHHVLVETPIK